MTRNILIILSLILISSCHIQSNEQKFEQRTLIIDLTDSNRLVQKLNPTLIQELVRPQDEINGVQFRLQFIGETKHNDGYSKTLAPLENVWTYNEFARRKEVTDFQTAVSKQVFDRIKANKQTASHSYVFYNLSKAINQTANDHDNHAIHALSDLRNKDEHFDSYQSIAKFLDEPKKFKAFMDKYYPIDKAVNKQKVVIHFYFRSSSRSEDKAYDQILNALLRTYYTAKGIKTYSHNSFSHLKNNSWTY